MGKNISDVQKNQVLENLRSVVLQTELSGNTSKIYEFSFAGGKSTYSFGLVQFDVGARADVQQLLKSIGFSEAEVSSLSRSGGLSKNVIAELNQKLYANKEIIENFTNDALAQKVEKLDALISEVAEVRPDVAQAILENPRLQMRILDYDNQFNISGVNGFSGNKDGSLMAYLKGESVALTGKSMQLESVGCGLTEENLITFRNNTYQGKANVTETNNREVRLLHGLKSISISTSDLPTGDAIDSDLPDGTRVVSTSTTVNGQTTVIADLVDKDGHVLLHAGAGQTMERDPETGIVQVRTGNSDQVQQYDPATGEVTNALRTGSDAAHVYENLLDAFSNPQIPTDQGIQVADASGALLDTSSHANTFTNFLDAQGTTLSSAQQDALVTQIDKLNIGGDKELSFYALPNGGALITNADGDIVGEIVHSSSGDLNLKATAIDSNGNTVEVNQHISYAGQSFTDSQYNTATQAQASAIFNSLMAANNWVHLSDVGKLSPLVNLYNATDKLGEAANDEQMRKVA